MTNCYDTSIFQNPGREYTIISAAKNEIVMILEFKKSGRVYIKEKEKEKVLTNKRKNIIMNLEIKIMR